MDEDSLPADESEEEFRKMEKDIDEFLTSIRENVSKNTDPQSEATCSGVYRDYDSISSDELENESDYHSLHSRRDESDSLSHTRKVNYTSSSKNRRGLRQWKWKGRGAHKQWKWKGRGVHKQRRSSFREEQHSNGGRGFRKTELSSSGDKYCQYRRQSSSMRDEDFPQIALSSMGEDEYNCPLSPRERDEFHQERSLSPKGRVYHHGRSVSSSGQDEYYEGSFSPEGRDDHEGERLYTRERYVFERREFSPEGIEEHSEDSYVFNEDFSQKRTSRSSETDSIYHKMYAGQSDSPTYWSESPDNDYEDQNSDLYQKHEGGDPFTEDEDGHSSSSGIMSTSSLITACVEKVISFHPEIAEKFTKACMSLLNKPVDRTFDSDYEYEESVCANLVDQSVRVSPRSQRGSRSPSFSESLGSFSGPSGSRHYRNR